jgi:hypothetical protein
VHDGEDTLTPSEGEIGHGPDGTNGVRLSPLGVFQHAWVRMPRAHVSRDSFRSRETKTASHAGVASGRIEEDLLHAPGRETPRGHARASGRGTLTERSKNSARQNGTGHCGSLFEGDAGQSVRTSTAQGPNPQAHSGNGEPSQAT